MKVCVLQQIRLSLLLVGLFACPVPAAPAPSPESKQAALEQDVTQGALRIAQDDGTVVECPLKHTDVQANIAGFIARVKVTQTFVNPTSEKIEAVYVFPLPHEAAVDDMTMVIGDRRIVGVIQRRAEARRIYEEALRAGQTAALLEQERPNIFTQSVGNIGPGQEVHIEISYVDVLRYDVGTYEFQFPMVVGPRYIPGAPVSSPPSTPPELQGKVSPPVPDTTRVPDASRISPPVLKPGVRNGHDISLRITLDAGVPIQDLQVANHRATVKQDGDRKAAVTLDPADSLPNKDFILRYDVTGQKPELAVLAHTGKHSQDAQRLGPGYFMLMIQPREDERLTKSPPREIVFLVDVSGSMSGEPTAKVIGAMQHMLKLCRPIDTVQVITFASQAFKLFENPLPVTEANIQKALNFTQGLQGTGGTEMLKGVKLAIDEPLDKERLRIVVMLTDGYIGNEAEIVEHVGKSCGDRIRFWAIGIGSSPNMFLIDGVAKQGGGMGKQLGLNDDSAALTQEIMTRIQRAQLAKVKIDWGTHQVVETHPAKLPELWAGRPVVVFGRYSGSGPGRITVQGEVEGEAVSWPLDVELPADHAAHDVLAKVWARKKIESLMQSAFYADAPAVEEEVTALALDYRLMSPYTSFVAVDAAEAQKLGPTARPPRRMPVPVPLPEGTRWEGFFGGEMLEAVAFLADGVVEQLKATAPAPVRGRGLARRNSVAMSFDALSLSSAAAPAPTTRATWGALSRARLPAVNRLFSSSGAASGGFAYRMAGPGGGARAGQQSLQRMVTPLVKRESAKEADESHFGLALAHQAQLEDVGHLLSAAQAALKAGQTSREQGKLDEARAMLVRAHLLATAAASGTYEAAAVADEAVQGLEQVHRQQVDAWTQETPALKTRLDLVLRDQSVTQSLAAVAEASGLTAKLIPGSLEDAAALAASGEPRVTFLDLRGATVSQALDWILQPAHLSWRLAKGSVVVGSDRRSGMATAWVYDVSMLALPSAEELKGLGDQAKQMEAVKKASDAFLQALRVQLGLKQEAAAVWFAPGQVLVTGTAETHAAAAKLFQDLADPSYQPLVELAELHKATVRRAAQRQDSAEKTRSLQRLLGVAQTHAEFGWPLLAAAAEGRVDLESLTELQIAWRSAETKKLLDGDGQALTLRSLWIVTEAARAVPDHAELKALADSALETSRQALGRVPDLPEKDAARADAWMSLVYAALARQEDADLRQNALNAMSRQAAGKPEFAPVHAVAAALLSEASQIDRQALRGVITNGVSGDDMVVLTALAARRAGGEVWQAFRAEVMGELGRQPLSGSVVVLLNRLNRPALPLVASR